MYYSNTELMNYPQHCWLAWIRFFFFFSLLFIVTCLLWIESSLSLSLFLFSWHSWWGKSRIPNKVQRITYAGRNFGWLAATVDAMFPLQESAPITPAPKEHKWTEMTYAAKLEMCVTSSILSLTGLLCFKCVSKPCTQMNDPAKEFLHAAQWNGLCGANLICGFAQTILGFEQICYALELGDEEEQHRGEWGLCEPLKICRPLSQDAAKPDLGGRVPVGKIKWLTIT